MKIPTAYPKPRKRKRSPRKPLTRVTRLKCRGKRTKKSGGHLFPKLVDRNYRAFIRTQPCVLAGRVRSPRREFEGPFRVLWQHHYCFSAIQACHIKSRGAGGADLGNLYPGCALAHDEQGRLGIKTFEKRWGLDLAKIAAGLALKYERAALGSVGALSQQEKQSQ